MLIHLSHGCKEYIRLKGFISPSQQELSYNSVHILLGHTTYQSYSVL